MRDMAQLRLQAEVSQLEGSLQASKGHVSLPPYIVSDASSLCDHLALVKQLVASARFILIIPIVGELLSITMLAFALLLHAFRVSDTHSSGLA
jgi:hypothetical protein